MASPQLANSINGYVAKLVIRRSSRHTLLVEGDSDRVILSSLLIRVQRDPNLPPVLIDSADTIKHTGLGNREIVEAVHATARARGIDSYACLVDREFRDFVCTNPYSDARSTHHVQEDVLFWTRGHSVENYLLVVESVIRYLEIAQAVVLPPHFRDVVVSAFDTIMVEALAFTLAAQGASIIGRAYNAVSMKAWQRDASGQPALNIKQISGILVTRAAPAPALTQFESLFDQHRAAIIAAPPPFIRWLTHGHLGTQVMWSGIGFVFSGFGIAADILDQFCRGQNEMKSQIGADLWAIRCQAGASEETPVSLINWLAGR